MERILVCAELECATNNAEGVFFAFGAFVCGVVVAFAIAILIARRRRLRAARVHRRGNTRMSDATLGSAEVVSQYYVVAVLDFLGQGEELKAMRVLPRKRDEEARYRDAARRTFGTISEIRGTFEKVFHIHANGAQRGSALRALLPPNQQEFLRAYGSVPLKLRFFSDTIVGYAPLSLGAHSVCLQGLYAMLQTCASVLLPAIAARTVFRGGIECGVGAEFWPDEVYGYVLSEAARLEKEEAKWPRVVVGRQLVKWAEHHASAQPKTQLDTINKIMAKECLRLVTEDESGVRMVHFLGPGVRDHVGHSSLPQIQQKVAEGLAFACQEHERFLKAKDVKHGPRYESLRRYYQSNVQAWGLQPRCE
jgi:hypothetical protein